MSRASLLGMLALSAKPNERPREPYSVAEKREGCSHRHQHTRVSSPASHHYKRFQKRARRRKIRRAQKPNMQNTTFHNVGWVVCDAISNSFKCLRCESVMPLHLPCPVEDFIQQCEEFSKKHSCCKVAQK